VAGGRLASPDQAVRYGSLLAVRGRIERGLVIMAHKSRGEGCDAKAEEASVPVSEELAAFIEENKDTFEYVVGKAMALQLVYGWSTEEAVAEVMREVRSSQSDGGDYDE